MKILGWALITTIDKQAFIGKITNYGDGMISVCKVHVPVPMPPDATGKKPKNNPALACGVHLSSVETGPFQTNGIITFCKQSVIAIQQLKPDSRCIAYIENGMGKQLPQIESPEMRIIR